VINIVSLSFSQKARKLLGSDIKSVCFNESVILIEQLTDVICRGSKYSEHPVISGHRIYCFHCHATEKYDRNYRIKEVKNLNVIEG